jgi:hypothetical protein
MDSQTTVVLSYCGLMISIASLIITAINHKRIRSRCCGHQSDLSIDIENTTPPTKKPLLS